MPETPEQLAQGRGDYTMSFIGRRITDLTGTAATSGAVPFMNTDSTIAEDSSFTYGSSLKVLNVQNVTGSTITLSQTTDPGAASEGMAILYLTDVSGSSVLRVRFNAADSQAQTIATEQ